MIQILEILLLLASGGMFLIQLVSCLNFSVAQRLGLQEKTEDADPLLIRAERYTAVWDLFTLIWMPATAIAMLTHSTYWPVLGLFAGAIYIDTAGREAAKNLSFRHHGLKAGTPQQQSLFFASYILILLIGLVVTICSVVTLLDSVIM